MVFLSEDVDLTIDYLLSITKDLDDDVPLYNSCYYPKTTKEYLETRGVKDFHPIIGIYDDKYHFSADYNFEENNTPIQLKELRKIPLNKRGLFIQHDIEDNYVFANYKSVIYYEGAVVLC